MAGRPSEVVEYGVGQARLQLAGREQLADPLRWWLADPGGHIHAQINWGNEGGAKQNAQPRAPARGNKASNH